MNEMSQSKRENGDGPIRVTAECAHVFVSPRLKGDGRFGTVRPLAKCPGWLVLQGKGQGRQQGVEWRGEDGAICTSSTLPPSACTPRRQLSSPASLFWASVTRALAQFK